MSYKKIYSILSADSTFADRVSVKDTEVTMRNGEKAVFPSFVMNVHDAIKASVGADQSESKNIILAVASQLATSAPHSKTAAVAVPAPPAAKAKFKKAAKEPLAHKLPRTTTKPIVVTAAKAGEPRKEPVQTVDADVVHRYQCAVACAQLLAALHQLFEKDDYPGSEERKKKLDVLIDDVEGMSTNHVNLSVKQLLRAKAKTNKV